jgi:hypothetical protein
MNNVETLRKFVEFGGNTYVPSIYVTAWERWAIKYQEIMSYGTDNLLCSVVVEEENEPLEINDTYDRIGNAKSLDDAVDMIERYLNNVLKIK